MEQSVGELMTWGHKKKARNKREREREKEK